VGSTRAEAPAQAAVQQGDASVAAAAAALRWVRPDLTAALAGHLLEEASAAGDRDGWLAAAGWAVHAAAVTGDGRGAACEVVAALGQWGDTALATPAARRLRVELAVVAAGAGEVAQAQRLLAPVVADAGRVDPELAADLLCAHARCAIEDATDGVGEALDAADAAWRRVGGRSGALGGASIALVRAVVERRAGRPSAAVDHAAEGLTLLDRGRTGATSPSKHLAAALAAEWISALLDAGRAADAHDGCTALLPRLVEQARPTRQLALLRLTVARAVAAADSDADSATLLGQAADDAAGADVPDLESVCRTALGALHEQADRLDAALEALQLGVAAERRDRERARRFLTALAELSLEPEPGPAVVADSASTTMLPAVTRKDRKLRASRNGEAGSDPRPAEGQGANGWSAVPWSPSDGGSPIGDLLINGLRGDSTGAGSNGNSNGNGNGHSRNGGGLRGRGRDEPRTGDERASTPTTGGRAARRHGADGSAADGGTPAPEDERPGARPGRRRRGRSADAEGPTAVPAAAAVSAPDTGTQGGAAAQGAATPGRRRSRHGEPAGHGPGGGRRRADEKAATSRRAHAGDDADELHDGPRDGSTPAGAGLDTAGLDAAGLDTAGLDAAGLDTAGLDAAGLGSAGLAGVGLGSAELGSAGLAGAGFDFGTPDVAADPAAATKRIDVPSAGQPAWGRRARREPADAAEGGARASAVGRGLDAEDPWATGRWPGRHDATPAATPAATPDPLPAEAPTAKSEEPGGWLEAALAELDQALRGIGVNGSTTTSAAPEEVPDVGCTVVVDIAREGRRFAGPRAAAVVRSVAGLLVDRLPVGAHTRFGDSDALVIGGGGWSRADATEWMHRTLPGLLDGFVTAEDLPGAQLRAAVHDAGGPVGAQILQQLTAPAPGRDTGADRRPGEELPARGPRTDGAVHSSEARGREYRMAARAGRPGRGDGALTTTRASRDEVVDDPPRWPFAAAASGAADDEPATPAEPPRPAPEPVAQVPQRPARHGTGADRLAAGSAPAAAAPGGRAGGASTATTGAVGPQVRTGRDDGVGAATGNSTDEARPTPDPERPESTDGLGIADLLAGALAAYRGI
jgi:hypothetical protein